MFCECRNVLVRYGRSVVLDVERLVCPAGRITAIIGPNGAGKTTLLEVMALLRRPNRGQVRLWGRAARPEDRDVRLRVVMAMIPGYMFRGSVWDNVLFGLRARGVRRGPARRRAAEALEMVRLGEFASRSAAGLSAGERQRVNLARAIAVAPEAILLDEPTANVDTEAVAVIREVLARLCREKGTTVVYTSAGDRQLESASHHIIRLRGGRVTGVLSPPEPTNQAPAAPAWGATGGRGA